MIDPQMAVASITVSLGLRDLKQAINAWNKVEPLHLEPFKPTRRGAVWARGNCIVAASILGKDRTRLSLLPYRGQPPDDYATDAWEQLATLLDFHGHTVDDSRVAISPDALRDGDAQLRKLFRWMGIGLMAPTDDEGEFRQYWRENEPGITPQDLEMLWHQVQKGQEEMLARWAEKDRQAARTAQQAANEFYRGLDEVEAESTARTNSALPQPPAHRAPLADWYNWWLEMRRLGFEVTQKSIAERSGWPYSSVRKAFQLFKVDGEV